VRLFSKLLIANRGEIAVRVARTCRVMGQPTVAIFSEPDRDALHVRECDEAQLVGPAEAARSYLSIPAIIDAARRSGADAVHPGYGFLSEDAGFAAAVAEAGLTFVGPPAEIHARMGDKQGARRMMTAAGVPVLPGYDGEDQSEGRLVSEAGRIGWPVMIKPSRGGGGKGMRVVRRAEDFEGALQTSRREARSSFGDENVVLERYVERPRHVEVQVLADASGTTVHLLERECSIQRRHQKVIEETPSPALTESPREELCAAALTAARTVGYVNAGTVEFLFDPDGRFYFLEMNTRLQVEHPITEIVTGFDLVRLQLEIAAGSELSFEQSDVVGRGHALECRVYAEDPYAADLPSAGRVLCFSAPRGPGVRCDEGVATGSEVPVHYDPLLAKLVTWGVDRNELLERTDEALRRTVVLGVATNIPRLRAIVEHAAFRSGEIHTGFIDEHLRELPHPGPPTDELVAIALAALEQAPGPGGASSAGRALPDPWSERTGWRLGEAPRE